MIGTSLMKELRCSSPIPSHSKSILTCHKAEFFFVFFTQILPKLLLQRALRIVLVFAILAIAPLISKSFLGNTLVIMAILQKCLGSFSSKTSTISLTLVFGKLIFNFDVCYISYKFATYSCLHLTPK